MAPPPALQRYADDAVNGKYKDVDKLWSRILEKAPALAAWLRKAKTTGNLDSQRAEEVKSVHRGSRKAAPSNNRGHRDNNPAKGNAAAQPKGVPQLTDLQLLDEDTHLVDEDGAALEIFDIEQLTVNSKATPSDRPIRSARPFGST